jgi:hypothetical protein
MKQLNKAVVYTLIAILLGTVTMITPLALLGPEAYPNSSLTAGASNKELDSQGLLDTPRGNDNYSSAPDSEQTATVIPSDLLQVGLLILPGFIVALGVFVFFRKRSF